MGQYLNQGVILHRIADPHSSFSLLLQRPGPRIKFTLAPSDQTTSEEGTIPFEELPVLFGKWAAAMRSEEEALSQPHLPTPDRRHLWVFLHSLQIENIRRFRDLKWKCADDSQGTLLIIGQNGTGKTTILRCLALLLLPRQIASSLLVSPYCRLVRRGEKEGRVEAVFKEGDREVHAHMVIRPQGDGEEITEHWSDSSVDFNDVIRVYAYGVARSYDAEGGQRTDPRLEAVRSLFFYSQPLVSAENVLLKLQALDHMQAQPEEFERALKRSVRKLLQLDDNFEFAIKPCGSRLGRAPETIGAMTFGRPLTSRPARGPSRLPKRTPTYRIFRIHLQKDSQNDTFSK